MYNPDYLERPYIVVLNKIDLPEVCGSGFLFQFFWSLVVLLSLYEFPDLINLVSYRYDDKRLLIAVSGER